MMNFTVRTKVFFAGEELHLGPRIRSTFIGKNKEATRYIDREIPL